MLLSEHITQAHGVSVRGRMGSPSSAHSTPCPVSAGEGHNTRTIGTALREYLRQEWLCKARLPRRLWAPSCCSNSLSLACDASLLCLLVMFLVPDYTCLDAAQRMSSCHAQRLCAQAAEVGTVPYEYQQQHAEPREFTATSFPSVRCREPWWLPSQVRIEY